MDTEGECEGGPKKGPIHHSDFISLFFDPGPLSVEFRSPSLVLHRPPPTSPALVRFRSVVFCEMMSGGAEPTIIFHLWRPDQMYFFKKSLVEPLKTFFTS